MTNAQLYLTLGVPLAFNTVLFVAMYVLLSGRIGGLDKRFDDMREVWRSELRRVEEVLDARLGHLEDHRR